MSLVWNSKNFHIDEGKNFCLPDVMSLENRSILEECTVDRGEWITITNFSAFIEQIDLKLKWTLAYKFKEGKKRKKEDGIWPAHQEYV